MLRSIIHENINYGNNTIKILKANNKKKTFILLLPIKKINFL